MFMVYYTANSSGIEKQEIVEPPQILQCLILLNEIPDINELRMLRKIRVNNKLVAAISTTMLAFLVLSVPVFATGAEEAKSDRRSKINITMGNGDHVSTDELVFADGKITVSLPYADSMQLDKEQVIHIVFPPGKGNTVSPEPVENDTVYTIKQEVISGSIISIDKSSLKIMPSYAPEKVSSVSLDKVSHCVFKKKTVAPVSAEESHVKVIFINDDLLTGVISQFTDGKFVFKPVAGMEFSFAPDQYQTIHNMKTSRQFFEGGLAAALMNVLKNADNIRSYGNYLFVAVIRGFIKSNDLEGAIYIFDHLSEFSIEPYIYQQLADEFYRAQQYDLAIKAYRTLIDSRQRNYYDYDKIIDCFLKLDRKAEAAEMCEKFLEQKENLVNYGKNPIDIHLKAADLYSQIKNFAKATEHLQAVITDKSSFENKRNEARQKLISIYKENGQLDTLIENYRKQLDEN